MLQIRWDLLAKRERFGRHAADHGWDEQARGMAYGGKSRGGDRCDDLLDGGRQVKYNGRPVIGFGQAEIVAPAVTTGPSLWTTAILTSVVGGATSWVVEEIAKKVRGKRR